MGLVKKVICLANSRKHSNYCFAGKEIQNKKVGEWVRPVSKRGEDGLKRKDICYSNGEMPKLLDIITIPLLRKTQEIFQNENYLIDSKNYWIKNAELPTKYLSILCDNVDSLWINGYHSRNGFNNRIPEDIVKEEINSSLLLINPDILSINVRKGYQDKRNVRANFEYKEKKYILMVTDPAIKIKYLEKSDGEYKINTDDVYLCISLGEIYYGYAYKLVAGIINLL